MEVGTVGYFNETSGYGFIKSEATSGDVFFHMNEVGDEDPVKGQQVLFEYEQTDKGPRTTAMSLAAGSDGTGESDQVEDALTESKTENSDINEKAAQGGMTWPRLGASKSADEQEEVAQGFEEPGMYASPADTTETNLDTGGSEENGSPTLRIPSGDEAKSARDHGSPPARAQLEAGDLAYLRLTHNGSSLGAQHPFRDIFTLLIGSGNCRELEEELHNKPIGTDGQFEVSTTDGTIRAPPLSVNVFDRDWLAMLSKEAGAETVQEFVELSGETLVDEKLLRTDQWEAIQNEKRSKIEEYELVEYEIVDAVRWRDPPENADFEG